MEIKKKNKLNHKKMSLINESQQLQVSEQRRLPVDNVGTDAITLVSEPDSIPLYYYNSGVLTADVGQAIGVLVVAKLTYRNIKNSLGDVTGTHKDTSVAFTSTAFTTIREFPNIKAELFDSNTAVLKAQAITAGFANGEYCIDHRTGTLYGIKASTQTSLASVTYKVETSTSGSGSGGVSSDVNITKVGGIAVKQGVVTPTATLTGVLNVLPEAVYNATPTTRTEGQGGPLQATAGGSLKTRGDEYDTTTSAAKNFEVSPLNSQFVNGAIDVDTTNVDATTHYHPSSLGATMDGAKDNSLSGKLIDADGTLTLTLQVTNDEDTTNADWKAIKFFDDDSAVGALVASLTVTNGTLIYAVRMNEQNYRYYRWVLVASGATNTVIMKGRTKAV